MQIEIWTLYFLNIGLTKFLASGCRSMYLPLRENPIRRLALNSRSYQNNSDVGIFHRKKFDIDKSVGASSASRTRSRSG